MRKRERLTKGRRYCSQFVEMIGQEVEGRIRDKFIEFVRDVTSVLPDAIPRVDITVVCQHDTRDDLETAATTEFILTAGPGGSGLTIYYEKPGRRNLAKEKTFDEMLKEMHLDGTGNERAEGAEDGKAGLAS